MMSAFVFSRDTEDHWRRQRSTMTYFLLLFLPCVLCGRTRNILPGYETVSSRDDSDNWKVLTIARKECKFPFRHGGNIHHHCITIGSTKPWCSLTHNFDRDRQWGYCLPENAQPNVFLHSSRRIVDPCVVNPCQNGGICTLVPHRRLFECTCPEGFSGHLCEKAKCYETIHQRYYDLGESWGRIYLRNVERCTCIAGETKCVRVRYTACSSNPCEHEGACRLIVATGEEVCSCRPGFSGPFCSFEAEAECYNSRGSDYRGVGGTTLSGARCLPWNSDLLLDELHVGTVTDAHLRGLGDHAYCRNPDGDKMPWCYTLNQGAISWEYCTIPSCVMSVWENQPAVESKVIKRGITASSHRMIPFYNSPTPTTKPTTKPVKSVCGKRHMKRVLLSRARVMGGTTAMPGTQPWMAALYISGIDFCAGTLVAPCWVVSAAHCFLRSPMKSHIRVVLGQQNFNESSPNTKTFGVDKYIFYSQFSVFNPTLHDIVLIKLKKENGRCVKKTPFIRPICLPDKNMTFPDHYCCTISGWGYKHEKAKEYSNLQEARVPLVSHDDCTKPEVYGQHVTSDMICAGANRCVDACQGDSGGPLACEKDDVSFLYGIISWGEGCGRSGKPGVYTKVTNYISWIHEVINRTAKSL